MKDISIVEKLHLQFYKCNKLLKRSVFEQRMEHIKAVPYRGQGRILRLLYDKGEMSQKDIVIEMDIRPSTAWELVGKLEKAGFIEKIQNPDDKRGSIIRLTEAGKREAMSAKWDLNHMAFELYSGLTTDEQVQLSELLGKLISSLKKSETATKDADMKDTDIEDDIISEAEQIEFFEDNPCKGFEKKLKCNLRNDMEESKHFFKKLFNDLGITKTKSEKTEKTEKDGKDEAKPVVAVETEEDVKGETTKESEPMDHI